MGLGCRENLRTHFQRIELVALTRSLDDSNEKFITRIGLQRCALEMQLAKTDNLT